MADEADPRPPGSGPLPAHRTLLGRLVMDATFRETFVAEPRSAVAAADIADVDEARLDEIEALSVGERADQVRTALNRFHANRWAGWWGMEMLDADPE